jgi:hypothetical protein
MKNSKDRKCNGQKNRIDRHTNHHTENWRLTWFSKMNPNKNLRWTRVILKS